MSNFFLQTASRVSSAFGFCFLLVFGVLAVFIGLAIIGWVCYNFFVERQPEFTGFRWLAPFGIGPAMVGVGYYWLRGLRRRKHD